MQSIQIAAHVNDQGILQIPKSVDKYVPNYKLKVHL
jgi:hypothetical protein